MPGPESTISTLRHALNGLRGTEDGDPNEASFADALDTLEKLGLGTEPSDISLAVEKVNATIAQQNGKSTGSPELPSPHTSTRPTSSPQAKYLSGDDASTIRRPTEDKALGRVNKFRRRRQ